MIGKGLLTGMAITFKRFFGKPMTVQYPEVKLPMARRFRGGFLELNVDKCIACSLCAMACPNDVIVLATEKDENNKKQLTVYKHEAGLCLFCNLCVEACPTKALAWTQNYEMAVYHRGDMTCDCLAEGRKRQSKADGGLSAAPSADSKGGVKA